MRECATIQPARLARALRRAVIGSCSGARADARDGHPARRARDGARTGPGEGDRRRDQRGLRPGWKPLRRQVTIFGSYVVLTEPVPELLEQINWTGGEAVFDGRMFLHYFRTTNDGRVLMGSGSGPIGFGGRVDQRFTHDARDRRARRARACAGSCPISPRRRSRTPGAARSTSRPTTCRSSARSPARGSTTAPATRATAPGRPGSAARSCRGSCSASTTS